MTNILYCIPSLSNSGGTERIVTEKINYLMQTGNYRITVVTTEITKQKPFYPIDDNVQIIELNLDFLADFNQNIVCKFINTKINLRKYAKKLKDIVNEHKIDICISTAGKEIEFLSKLDLNCIKICELHFSKNIRKIFYTSRKKSKFWKWLGEYRNYQLIAQTKTLDRLVVLTKHDAALWEKTNRNVSQIYNFSTIEHAEILAPLQNKKVISVGRLEFEKGYDLLIDAWKIVHKVNNEWILEIFGYGSLFEELAMKIKNEKLNNCVFLRGRTDDVKKVFTDSSLFVLSSLYEGFPMVLLESMSCGLPVVSFDCESGPREIILDEFGGILVEDKNVEKLATGILELINDDTLRKTKGKEAKEKSKEFSKEIIMDQWIKLFSELQK